MPSERARIAACDVAAECSSTIAFNQRRSSSRSCCGARVSATSTEGSLQFDMLVRWSGPTNFFQQLQADLLDISGALADIFVFGMPEKINEKLPSLHDRLGGGLSACENLFREFLHQKDIACHRKIGLQHRGTGGGQGVLELFANAVADRCYGFFDALQFPGRIACRLAGSTLAGRVILCQNDHFALTDAAAYRRSENAGHFCGL